MEMYVRTCIEIFLIDIEQKIDLHNMEGRARSRHNGMMKRENCESNNFAHTSILGASNLRV